MFRTLSACVFLLVASLTAVPAFSLSSSELVAQATEARDSGNYRNAVRLYKQAADQGSAEAMNALGVMSMRGLGVPKDDRQAFFWIKKAADRGYPPAQKNFGILYAEGIWVKPNKAKAKEWMQLAADNGNAEAQAWLDGKPAPAADTQIAQSSSPQSTSNPSPAINRNTKAVGWSQFSHRFLCVTQHGTVASAAGNSGQEAGALFVRSALLMFSDAEKIREENERLNTIQMAVRQAEIMALVDIRVQRAETLSAAQNLWEDLTSKDCRAAGLPTPLEINGLDEAFALEMIGQMR